MMMKKLVLFGMFFFQIHLISAQNLMKLTIILSELPEQNILNYSMFLAGDFNSWNPQNNANKFSFNEQQKLELILSLPEGVVNFKVTKGGWDKVECNSTGGAINNRSVLLKSDTTIYLKIESFSDQFKKEIVKSTASSNVYQLDSTFYIPQLGIKRRIWIYLPSSYLKSKKRYPVMYAHDGQNLFDKLTSGYGEWGIDEVLDSIAITDKKESIIIGIDHGGKERLSEYNPYDSKFGAGKGDQYVDFIVKTLKPFIDSKYRTYKERKSTAIIGSSMGGLISMFAAVKYPKVFGYVGVFSPAFWIAPQLYRDVENASLNKETKFYFLAGEKESKDMVPDMRRMYDLLLSKGFPSENLKFIPKADGQHSEWFWRREFPDFINFLGDKN